MKVSKISQFYLLTIWTVLWHRFPQSNLDFCLLRCTVLAVTRNASESYWLLIMKPVCGADRERPRPRSEPDGTTAKCLQDDHSNSQGIHSQFWMELSPKTSLLPRNVHRFYNNVTLSCNITWYLSKEPAYSDDNVQVYRRNELRFFFDGDKTLMEIYNWVVILSKA